MKEGLALAGLLCAVPAGAQTAPSNATGEDESTVYGSAPLSAASSQTVRDRDLQLRPVTRAADALEVAPGLLVVQHAGGGKANQYFLRGFDADHGTDLALSLDDVPLNMVSHGHGQGYADPHFLVPELIERIDVREGPYFAQDGNFATAGAINLRLRETVERSSLTLEDTLVANPALGAGMLGNARFLGVMRTDVGAVRGYLAAEVAHQDGPSLHPQDFNHVSVIGRWNANLSPTVNLALTVLSYAGAWNASGQIPSRLIGQPFEGRTFTQFDAVDPSEGGASARHQGVLTLRARPSSQSEFRVTAYAGTSRLALFSNFTYFLDDPVRGDQLEQDDARNTAGLRATYRRSGALGSWRFLTTAGATIRYDAIDNGLHHTENRARLDEIRSDRIRETNLALFAEEQVAPVRWLRAVLGLRGDFFDFSANGTAQAGALSPKATLVLSPVRRPDLDLDFYINYGRGFHSNDARGAVLPTSPALEAQCADPMRVPTGVTCPVTPLTVAAGYEIGARTRLFRRVDLAAAAWMLDLDHETVWNGDRGTTEVAGPTRRMGVTVALRAEILRWLWADADVSFVNAVYRDNPGNANAVALAPSFVLAAGLSMRHPNGLFGALRLRMVGDRPADPAGTLQAQGFALFNAQVGYRHAWYEIATVVENLFNATWREAQFEEDSRLRNEPTACPAANPGCHTDMKFTAGTPLAATLRFSVLWR